MNFAGLSIGTKVLLVGGLALLIDSFLDWQQISFLGHSAGQSMWHGIGVVAGLFVIALLLWEIGQVTGVTGQLQLPVSATLVSVGLAAATALFTIIKFLVAHQLRHWPAWIGLILAIVLAIGGWFKFGESPATAPMTTTPPAPPAPPA
ncbi:MAG: hypothetical protein E6G64_01345 [Actinobacteria bacterium]|nr:MAG: hypothetical protein E6G64_01345 [Actinomycetota bacterium]